MRKIEFITLCVDYLNSKKGILPKELQERFEVKSAIERNLQLAIESVIDICQIIISQENLSRPEDYKSMIKKLGDFGLIPKDFSERFALRAGLRNILVHVYEKIDAGLISKFLSENLEDFNVFIEGIKKYILRLEN